MVQEELRTGEMAQYVKDACRPEFAPKDPCKGSERELSP